MATTVLVNAQVPVSDIILMKFSVCDVVTLCAVCDGTFFPELQKEMEDVVGWFNENAQKLLELHLASSFKKCLTWFKGKTSQDLVNYALQKAMGSS